METNNGTAVIEKKVAGKPFTLAGLGRSEAGITKIFIAEHLSAGWAQQDLPEAQIVSDQQAILGDHEIDLVLIPESEKNNLEMVSNVLQSGKNVRIV